MTTSHAMPAPEASRKLRTRFLPAPESTRSKNPGNACEQIRNDCGKSPRPVPARGLIPCPPGVFPKLFLPWNSRSFHEERAFSGFVHMVKKKILWSQKTEDSSELPETVRSHEPRKTHGTWKRERQQLSQRSISAGCSMSLRTSARNWAATAPSTTRWSQESPRFMRRPGTIWPFLTTGFSTAAPTDRIAA